MYIDERVQRSFIHRSPEWGATRCPVNGDSAQCRHTDVTQQEGERHRDSDDSRAFEHGLSKEPHRVRVSHVLRGTCSSHVIDGEGNQVVVWAGAEGTGAMCGVTERLRS